MDLPLGLEGALETGNVVLFLGSGIGHYMINADGETMPDGAGLAERLASALKLDISDTSSLAKVAQLAEIRVGRVRTVRAIKELFAGYEPNDDIRWLFSMTWKAIYTTNYDDYIERCYRTSSDNMQNPVVMTTNSEVRSWLPTHEVPLVHLHGALETSPAGDNLLLTQKDYATHRSQREMLFNLFRTEYPDTPILYVGYSNEDTNWAEVTTELRAQFSPGVPPKSYRLAPSTPELDRELLAHDGIETIDGTVSDLRAAVVSRFGDLRVQPGSLDKLKAQVPSQLHAVFEAQPAPLARLLVSWEYVNQADFSETPNTRSFHNGNRPNWGVIGAGINFERDIEKPIVDDLLDFYTSPEKGLRVATVLGSAGYGVSTLLRAVSAWYVRAHASTVLLLKAGAEISDGDVEFAVKNLPGPVIFVVDNAADHLPALNDAKSLLRTIESPAYLLLGERLNEWRGSHPKLGGVEFQIDPLSDLEIDRLLTSLENASALGKLAELTPELRFSAVKTRNQQELLVTMREVTEGKSFDAIIEDEFRGLQNEHAADIYALVCAFSRVRALARDLLISDALQLDHGTMYRVMNDYLEGTVIWETVDYSRGIDGLRARHQIIADIVWDRCLDQVRRERTLIGAMKALNLTHGVDAKAFEKFTRDDVAVDSLQTIDAKTRFFEEATRKDPGSPFVKQHYARMLRRERKLDLALAQIESAIATAGGHRSLHHTRGVILRDLAIDAESREVARRWLTQSEAAFETAIRMNPRDEYGYQSLAELYLDWAGKVENPREAVDYLTKAQETVVRGLDKAVVLEGLYIVESKIQRVLGDTPARITALRTALEESPTSGIVRFMLGNALRFDKQTAEAVTVLHDGLEMYPDDPRIATSYAHALREAGRGFGESVAAMRLATTTGLRDPLFVATFGGMLALNGELEEAASVWQSAKQRGFSPVDQKRPVYKPLLDGVPTKVSGVVSAASPTFAFIETETVGDVFCPGFRIGGRRLTKGQQVEFELAFNPLGPTVLNLL
ncbi:SIR2 family protein [Leucobacter weissii]|uniref:SIR2 family protein n=1 Tax=Leucobacter weissii TaxID=1983706 RepID=A0A939MML9_9MICO|nr:SIR2 family protein [Leucobacter weissii]MBO1902655.1 SIR2 family protein [Leucobacter weissii]